MTDIEQVDAELDAYIIDDLEYEPESEARTLATIDEADRALRRVSRIDIEAGRIERLFDARIQQMQDRRAEVLAVYENERRWWTRRVELWARAHKNETGSKTIKLPSGTLSFRAGSQSIQPLSKEPGESVPAEFVRVKREWDRTAVKAATMPGPVAEDYDAPEGYEARLAVTADGEVLGDVVRLVPVQDSITIKAGEK